MATQDEKLTKLSFARTFMLPALLLFVIPLFSWWFFHHVQSDYNRRFLAAAERDIKNDMKMSAEQRTKALEFFQKIPLSQMLASGSPEAAQMVPDDARFRMAVFRWMIRISVLCILSGIGVFIIGAISVWCSLRSQLAQYYSLSAGWYVLRVFATLQVLAQGSLAIALSFWMTAFWMHSYYPKLIVIAAVLALGAVAAIISAIFKKIDDEFVIEGCLLERTAHQALWADLDRICQTVGTAPPDRIVAGIDNNFFVTEHPVTVEGKVYTGRTLYVSLSLLKVLEGTEADAVMAHEMAHFSGNDTMYSKKISPLLNRYTIYLGALAQGLALPVFYFMLCFWGLFQISLGKLKKEREFRADKIAAGATSPKDIAHSLLKIAAYSEYRGKVEQELFDAEKVMEKVGISHRVATGFSQFASAFAKDENLADLQTAHPFDAHPPTVERWEAVGVKLAPEEMAPILMREADGRWFRNIDHADELEQKQWAEYEEKFQKAHEKMLAYRYVPETEAEKAVVLKYFPGVSFEGKKGQTLKLEYDKITFSDWDDPVLFSEITNCATEDSTLGHPQLRTNFKRNNKSMDRKFLLDIFKVDKDEILNALNDYYSREMAMREFRKEKQLAELTREGPPPIPKA